MAVCWTSQALSAHRALQDPHSPHPQPKPICLFLSTPGHLGPPIKGCGSSPPAVPPHHLCCFGVFVFPAHTCTGAAPGCSSSQGLSPNLSTAKCSLCEKGLLVAFYPKSEGRSQRCLLYTESSFSALDNKVQPLSSSTSSLKDTSQLK